MLSKDCAGSHLRTRLFLISNVPSVLGIFSGHYRPFLGALLQAPCENGGFRQVNNFGIICAEPLRMAGEDHYLQGTDCRL
jgi:hypothetical protein